MIVVGLIGWISLYALWRLFLRARFSTVHPEKLPPGVLGNHTIEISEKCLRETTDVNDTAYAWENIGAIEQDEQYLYIFVGMLCAYIIPKQAFTTIDEVQAFHHLVNTYIHKARGKRYRAQDVV
ncbi:MAG: hypothetical protein GFH27_549415n48 [Chloroflexi bacterium AL-W]|nr:hypothetical protein [Chloroflexi bacterium AL-N1]NOK71496.1 hypothetical protein [Chloroflexi bacterium AL-N10]NOK77277.1 hypothetical protein [Chloroflexi bacterium AL-N5]NOK86317.1 hypothetical protein [Chloroflexi bacterium AL-W]NOK93287.1 hypothetical protein [Chloroflexi bacterium AL-N15]